MLASRKSLAEVTVALNAENAPTRTGPGTQSHPKQVQRIVTRPAGHRRILVLRQRLAQHVGVDSAGANGDKTAPGQVE